jgi:hypothetical protein
MSAFISGLHKKNAKHFLQGYISGPIQGIFLPGKINRTSKNNCGSGVDI